MTMTALVSLVVCVVGLVVYLAAPPTAPKATEVGRLAFACGLLCVLLEVGTRVVRF
jgi:hypothetical protein